MNRTEEQMTSSDDAQDWKTLAIFLRGSLNGLLCKLTSGFNEEPKGQHKLAINEALYDDLYAAEQIDRLRKADLRSTSLQRTQR